MSDDEPPVPTPCPTCGARADTFVELFAQYQCTECGAEYEQVDAIPRGALEQLIDEWQTASEYIKSDGDIDANAYARALSKAATDLESTIQEHE